MLVPSLLVPSLLVPVFLVAGLFFSLLTPVRAADAPKKRDITLDDLTKLQRVGAPVVSPDGEWVAYTVSQIDTKEDKSQSHLWMVKWDGSVHLQLTYGKDGASSPKFSPDGKYISFMSSRPGPAKGDQIWVMDRRGGEAEQFTAITDQNIEGYSWSPDSKGSSSLFAPSSNQTLKKVSRLHHPSPSSLTVTTSSRTSRATCATTSGTRSTSTTLPAKNQRNSPPARM